MGMSVQDLLDSLDEGVMLNLMLAQALKGKKSAELHPSEIFEGYARDLGEILDTFRKDNPEYV